MVGSAMARFWPALRSFLSFYRFASAELEGEFQRRYQRCTILSCHLTAAMQVPILVSSIINTVLVLPVISSAPTYWALYSVPLACAALLAILPHFPSVSDSHLNCALALCYCFTVASWGLQFSVLLERSREHYASQPEFSPMANEALEELMSYLFITRSVIDQQLQLMPMYFIGFRPASLVAIVSGPTITLMLVTLGFVLSPSVYLYVPISLCLAAISILYCYNVSTMRRSIFLLELQQKRHSDQLQHADGIVNHIVKNAMVEAAGLIDTFLDLCTPPPPQDLVQEYLNVALERLRSGMVWCRRRRVLLALMDEDAKPNPAPTSLVALGKGVVAARAMTTSLTNLTVELDEALTDFILENAIDNAFRHGHPTDPDVHFAITAHSMDPVQGTCTVAFHVTNRSHPNHQCLTVDKVEGIMRRQSDLFPSTSFSDGIGLRHCFLAAELQKMSMSLSQEGDTVTFHASIVARLVSQTEAPAATSVLTEQALPVGLKISVIDDSPPARLLLKHQLCRDIPGCIVDVFGESAEDVDPFVSHTLTNDVDIAILDQHLHWSSGNLFYGTDLVRQLLQAGFPGLICIRSANTSEYDLQQYSSAGAHCVIDKVVSRAQLVATLTSMYQQILTPRDTPTTWVPSQSPSFTGMGAIRPLWPTSQSS